MIHRRVETLELSDSAANGEETRVGNHPLDMRGATRIESPGDSSSQNSCGRYDPYNENVSAVGRERRGA
jgi:hypothetical protein